MTGSPQDRPSVEMGEPSPRVRALPVVALERRPSRSSRTPRWLRRTAGPVVLLALWQLLTSVSLIRAVILPKPTDIAAAGWQLMADGTLGEALLVSSQRVLLGLMTGGTIGVVLAVVSGLSRLGEDLIDPLAQMFKTVPWIGLAPLFILWFGIGETPKFLLVAFAVLFPLYLNLYAGIRGVDLGLIETAQVLGLSRWQTVTKVILPGALPSLLVGLRFSLSLSWVALIFAETLNAQGGIGYLIVKAQQFLNTDVMIFCLVLYAFLGLASDWIVRILERLLLSWRSSFGGE